MEKREEGEKEGGRLALTSCSEDEDSAAHGHPGTREESLDSHPSLSDSQVDQGWEREPAPPGMSPGYIGAKPLGGSNPLGAAVKVLQENVYNKPRLLT